MQQYAMRDKGQLASWNDDKGYGFIAPFSGAVQGSAAVGNVCNRFPPGRHSSGVRMRW